VYEAFALKGTPRYREALERVIFVHRRWPLIRYWDAILAAEADLEARIAAVEAEPWRHYELLPEPDLDVRALAASRSSSTVAP
jgi:hypothetical protein